MDSDSTPSPLAAFNVNDSKEVKQDDTKVDDSSPLVEDFGNVLELPPPSNDKGTDANVNLPSGDGGVPSLATSATERRSTELERPEWLPEGWVKKPKIRSSGASVGKVDWYYFDPVSHRSFRSKKEVIDYLGLGTSQRPVPKPMAEESMDCYISSASSEAMEFDDNNVPETVTWVLTGPRSWTPFIGGEQVPESTKKGWDDVYERRMGGQN
ncbi:methyl-CpG-binding domain-containing protein 5-like [Tasmannia lanceolata]|uniref:methyl-CpG-binding domain-containing protein 5-like n=1 Tax=Tasmannia lanceolata TaxID=3420 RepID=UPI004062F20A